MAVLFWVRAVLTSDARNERGDIAAWTLILLMSSMLVVAIFAVARDRLLEIVSAALSNVCGGVGC